MRNINKLLIGFSLVAVASGCGRMGFESSSFQAVAISPTNLEFDPGNELKLDELNSELSAAQKSLMAAEIELNKVDIFSTSSGGVAQKGVSDIVDKVLDKVVVAAEKANAKILEVHAKVEEKLAELDPLNPLHLPLIAKGEEILNRIDSLRLLFSGAVQRMRVVIDAFTQKIEGKLKAMDPKSPLTWAAMILWQQVSSNIDAYKVRLAAI